MSYASHIPSSVALRSPLLRDANLFNDFWNDFGGMPNRLVGEPAHSFVPHIDVTETEEAYDIRVELPGLEASDFEVVAEDDILTLKGEKKRSEESESDGIRRSESVYGSFLRRLRFPEAIAEEGLRATYKNGVLNVTLPKPAEARPQVRSIPVQSAA
jgi:HSP20 family protein